jgi:predicted RNase H-like nuclease (RuvC/YqgF family)
VEDLHGKFPLTPEDMEAVKKLLASNEELMKAVAGQLNGQQKLVLELAKHRGKGTTGLDYEQLTRMNHDLRRGLEELKRRTEALKQQLDETRRGPTKPQK